MQISRQLDDVQHTTQFVIFLRRLRKNKSALFGIGIFLFLCVLAVLSPYISPYPYDQIDMPNKLAAPSLEHFCGTDKLGRDIFSRLLYGGRYSLTMGVLAVLVSMSAGVLLGAIAGYYGGWVDSLIMRILDVFNSIPSILLAIVMSAVLGNGYFMTVLALSVPRIPHYARLLRAQFLQVGQQEYVEAAQSISCSNFTIMMKHILPNAWSPLIVSATMDVSHTILSAAALSYIGLGIQAPTPEWGAMLSDSRDFMRDYPFMVIFPGLLIMISVLGLNMFGDGVRDALDPKLKD